MSLEPDHREQTIRDRSAWAMEWYGGTVLFSGAEVGHLLRTIDELRDELVAPAQITPGPFGPEHTLLIGPEHSAWAGGGEFAGRHLRLPNGSLLKFHTAYLSVEDRAYVWYVPLPADPDELKRSLLEIAKHERLEL